jgi:hypothetical protein
MAEARNSAGIGNDGSTTNKDFDGFGNAYSAQALAAAGVAGSTVTHGGVSFGWPVGSSTLDNFVTIGQTIRFPQSQPTGHLAWLGSSSNGPSTGTGTLHYSDGTSQPFTLALSDWTLAAGTGTPLAGNEIAVTTTYRINHGSRENVNTYIFYATTPLDSTRTLSSVTLPSIVGSGRIHVFSAALAP